MKDGRRPHRWPGTPSDGDTECIAWKCAACGGWISEYRPQRDDCPVNWRRTRARWLRWLAR